MKLSIIFILIVICMQVFGLHFSANPHDEEPDIFPSPGLGDSRSESDQEINVTASDVLSEPPYTNSSFGVITDTLAQKASLEKIISWIPKFRHDGTRVSFLDETFLDWLERTGELPPDFENMPSLPFIPDPLILDEGGRNIPVKTMDQWGEKREWMKVNLQHYITGTYPPPPDNLRATLLSEKKDGETTVQMLELSFGPDHQAKLTVELMIPPGEGPFPVFITQWSHRIWALVAVRRGYIGCVYAGADNKDDTEKYSEIWAGEYDFNRNMRRSWGASRAIDYLYTLPYVDKEKIGITGHSRNARVALYAAAFDQRITACIPSSGSSGSDNPWRYTSINYGTEDIGIFSWFRPSWFHPRLNFFIGREHKLPVDQNHFMALIAPRGLMLSNSLHETLGNPWGIEQAYHASRKVYEFLGAENNLAIRTRHGKHSLRAQDMEDYMDFFDYIFKRSDHKPENRLFYDYSFEKWLGLSKEKLNPMDFPVKGIEDIKTHNNNQLIRSLPEWESKKSDIKKRLKWLLGDEPPGVNNPGPGRLSRAGAGEDGFGSFLERPQPTSTMGKMPISGYSGFGDYLYGTLYYPLGKDGNPESRDMPVLIYLHEFNYSHGFTSHQLRNMPCLYQSIVDQGYAVFAYDMIGFGNRIEEGTRFYQRYPNWSKMGKMVTDAKGAIDAMENLDFIDGAKIFIAGYSLGATVGLFAAALDERVAGVVSVAGFTPMRLNTADRGTEGIKAWSHLHGLIPRLGFFAGNEARIPVDYHEVLASIAPRPLLVIAPVYDKDAHLQDIEISVGQAGKIYDLFEIPQNIEIFSPDDFNRFSLEMREKMFEWLPE
jgi:dienelactone hydrolase